MVKEQPLPTFERPILASLGNMTSTDERKLTQLHCKEEIIKWLISVLLIEGLTQSPSKTNLSISTNTATNSTNSTVGSSGIGSSIADSHYSSNSTIGTLISNYDIAGSSLNRANDLETL